MPRRLLTKSEKKHNRCFRLTDAEMRRLDELARREKISQSRFRAKIIASQ